MNGCEFFVRLAFSRNFEEFESVEIENCLDFWEKLFSFGIADWIKDLDVDMGESIYDSESGKE